LVESVTAKLSWPRVFAEGVAIVGSILLAFGIQAWWEGRQLRAEEAVLVEGLRRDFAANQAALAGAVQTHQDMIIDLTVLDRMSLAGISALPADSAELYAGGMSFTLTFDAQDATLDAIVASGRLEIISDIRLREHLARWKQLVADADEEARDFRDASRHLSERQSIFGGPWGGPWATVLQSFSPEQASLVGELPQADFQAVIDDKPLRDLLRVKRFYSVLYLRELRLLQQHAAEVNAILEAWGQ